MIHLPSEIMARAAQAGDGAAVASAWEEIFAGGALLNGPHKTADAILFCAPGAAPAMMAGLREAAKHSDAKWLRSTLYVSSRTIPEKIKMLSVLYAAGFDLGSQHAFAFSQPIVRLHIKKLATYQQSSHSLIEGLRSEPDPEALISRPINGRFHGTYAERFRGDMKFWQPFVRWMHRNTRTASTILQVTTLLAMASLIAASLASQSS